MKKLLILIILLFSLNNIALAKQEHYNVDALLRTKAVEKPEHIQVFHIEIKKDSQEILIWYRVPDTRPGHDYWVYTELVPYTEGEL